MVKLSNKGKGKPTKRKSLKIKYKIQRKVKQHKKKMRQEAKKYQKNGIKPRKNQKDNMLPNSYPFKTQILQQFKSQKPTVQACDNQMLNPTQWGLLALENSNKFLPRDKDHLTKKYFTNIEKIWEHCNIILQVLDARNVEACIDQEFRNQCRKRGLKILTIVSKIDSVTPKKLGEVKKQLGSSGIQFVEFSIEPKKKNACLEELLEKIGKLSNSQKSTCVVVGKPLTGKHSIIKQLMKSIKFYNDDYATMADVKITSNISIIDTPYKLQNKSENKYPLFHLPSSLASSGQSLMLQQENALKYLFTTNQGKVDRNQLMLHYNIQDYNSLDDLLKKIGKSNRMFGKGGMVDLAMVRTKVLSDWYSGRLNNIFE